MIKLCVQSRFSLCIFQIFCSLMLALSCGYGKTLIDSSQHNIIVNYDYDGTHLILFGASNEIKADEKLFVEIEGPKTKALIRNLKTSLSNQVTFPSLYYGEKSNLLSQQPYLYNILSKKGMYKPAQKVTIKDNFLFKSLIHLPIHATTGEYNLYLKKQRPDGNNILIAQDKFYLNKSSLLKKIENFSYTYPVFNSLLTILIAVILSSLLQIVFKKI